MWFCASVMIAIDIDVMIASRGKRIEGYNLGFLVAFGPLFNCAVLFLVTCEPLTFSDFFFLLF